MTVVFDNEELEFLYVTPVDVLRGKQKSPSEVIRQYQKKVRLLTIVNKLEELRNFRSLNFEYLKGNRAGYCSIRLNIQYRLLFTPIEDNKIQVLLINEISKHYE